MRVLYYENYEMSHLRQIPQNLRVRPSEENPKKDV